MNAVDLFKIRRALMTLALVYDGRHKSEFAALLIKLKQENIEMELS